MLMIIQNLMKKVQILVVLNTPSYTAYIVYITCLYVNLILWFMNEHMSDRFWFDAIISHVVLVAGGVELCVCMCVFKRKQLRNLIVFHTS